MMMTPGGRDILQGSPSFFEADVKEIVAPTKNDAPCKPIDTGFLRMPRLDTHKTRSKHADLPRSGNPVRLWKREAGNKDPSCLLLVLSYKTDNQKAMMSLFWTKDGMYRLTGFQSESDLETAINQVKAELFGQHRIYLDVKRKIRAT